MQLIIIRKHENAKEFIMQRLSRVRVIFAIVTIVLRRPTHSHFDDYEFFFLRETDSEPETNTYFIKDQITIWI